MCEIAVIIGCYYVDVRGSALMSSKEKDKLGLITFINLARIELQATARDEHLIVEIYKRWCAKVFVNVSEI